MTKNTYASVCELLSQEDESEYWTRYKVGANIGARTKLIDNYIPYAKMIAAVLYAKRPGEELEFSDYMQYATIGLIEAVDSFDPHKNVSFKTYANYRIRGAVLNGIESSNERMSQLSFRRRVQNERVDSVHENKSEPLQDVFLQVVDTAIGLALGYLLEDSGMYRNEDDTEESSHDPYNAYELKRLQEMINELIKTLPSNERLVIRYHYFNYLNFSAIADILGLSKGRVSQLHASALQILRKGLGRLNEVDVKC